jgi:hypothetical protein
MPIDGETRVSIRSRSRSALKGAPWLRLIAMLALACCGGHHDPPHPEPVEECRLYEAAVKNCFHRDISIASQASLLPATDADRERVRAMCSNNLQRIQKACR